MKKYPFIIALTFACSVASLFLTTSYLFKVKFLSATPTRITKTVKAKPSSPVGPMLTGVKGLEKLSIKYFNFTKGLAPNQECLPVPMEVRSEINIDYLHCTDDALASDGEEKNLTSNFVVSKPLARKYNFWRRIYSHFSSNQHVLHLSAYPEVVLEIYDTDKGTALSYHKQRRIIRRIAKAQKRYYRKLFKKLHKNRKVDVSRYSADMKRIARLMAHIKVWNKYQVAALSMRTQTGQRNYIAKGLAEASKYMSAIEAEFDRQGVPRELSRIAFVESSFNLKARSKVGASGVYQIMPKTGRQYLKIRVGIDERNDPIKAARAAAKLLKLNYKITKRWPLAVTAYNHGVGSIKRAVRKTGSRNIETIIAKYKNKNFGFASKNFYTEYLAILGTLHDAHWLFPGISRYDPITFDTVRLPRAYSIKTVRRKYKISNNQISTLNPDISYRHVRNNGILPRGYVLKIPVRKQKIRSVYWHKPSRT